MNEVYADSGLGKWFGSGKKGGAGGGGWDRYNTKGERIGKCGDKSAGEGKVESDVNSSLVIHRIKLHFGKLGTYETTIERVGKTDYTELYESSILDDYTSNSSPYLEQYIKTVPIYERNTNITLTLKSSHPTPATLHSLSWEGDYSPRFYNRV